MAAEAKAYNDFFYYLRDIQYPEHFTKDQKRNLRKKAQKFVLDNGALFFVGLEKSEPRVHNTDKQTKILVALAGHFGRNKTREKVCAHFDGKMFSLKLDYIYETLPYYGLKYVRIAMNQSSDAMFASAA